MISNIRKQNGQNTQFSKLLGHLWNLIKMTDNDWILQYKETGQSLIISECLSFADDVLLLDMLPMNLICDMMFSQKHFSVFQVERFWVLRSVNYIIMHFFVLGSQRLKMQIHGLCL